MRRLLLIAAICIATYTHIHATPLDLAISLIKQHEGYSAKIYTDTMYKPTIGWGTNLSYITVDEAEYLLRSRLIKSHTTLLKTYPWYSTLPYIPKSVVLDMHYNVGSTSFKTFRKMHYQLERSNWVKAAIEMKASLWFRQVGTRGNYLYRLMINYKG